MKDREGGQRRRRCRAPLATVGAYLMRLVREDGAQTCPRQAGKGGGKPLWFDGRQNDQFRRRCRADRALRRLLAPSKRPTLSSIAP